MKPYLLALVLAALYISGFSQACCCTGACTNYSILPNVDKNVVGMRYSFSSYNSTAYSVSMMNMEGMNMSMMGPGNPAIENMHTLDIFGRFVLPKRFYISLFVPVHILEENSALGNSTTTGLGDVSALLQYAVFNTKKCSLSPVKHQLRLGAGLKAPTGKFSMTPEGMFSTDLQLGTGSFDFLLNAVYTLRYKQFGVNVTASYKKNLENSDQFRFGDKAKGGVSAFYLFKLPVGITLMPQVGVSYDYAFYNIWQSQTLSYTGGQYLIGNVGFDIYYKDVAFSASVSPPLMSLLNWSGEPYERIAMEAGIYYSFSKIIPPHKKKQNEISKTN